MKLLRVLALLCAVHQASAQVPRFTLNPFTGYLDISGDYNWAVVGLGPLASRPATCTAGRDVYICVGAGCTAGQSIHVCTATDSWDPQGTAAGGGITSLGGQIGATQVLAVGTTGSDFNIVSGTNTHTFHLPDASDSVRGVMTTGNQVFAGIKTFDSPVLLGTPVVGNGGGNDKLSFVPEATNPTCGAGAYYIWSNSGDNKLKKCENGSISDLDTGGGAIGFSAITTGSNTTAAMTCGSGCSILTAGTGFITANRFTGLDSVFTLQDDGDVAKQAVFQLSGITTGNTRTVVIADSTSVTVVPSSAPANQFATAISGTGLISYAQPSFANLSGAATNGQLPATISTRTIDNSNTFTIRDDRLTLQDNADTTKQLVLELSAIGTSTTRTLNIPNGDSVTVLASSAPANQFATGISGAGAVSYAQPAFTNISGTATNGQLPATLSSKTIDNSNTIVAKDSIFTLQDDADPTKQTVFQASGITTSTTRTVTLPNANSTLVVPASAPANQFATGFSAAGVESFAQPSFSNLSGTATNGQLPTTLSSKTLDNTNAITVQDTNLTVQDNADNTKQLILQLSGIGTGATRTLNIPNADSVTVISSTAGSNQFATGISAAGAISYAQPSFGNLSGTASPTQGGTGQSTWTLGDLLYASAANTLAKLAGNTTTTKQFLRQTGNGSISAAPAWDTLVAGDVPDISATYQVLSAKNASSGYAGLTAGTKITLAHGQEVWALEDLTNVGSVTGTGTVAVLATSPTLAGTPVIGDGSGNDKLEFAEEATNPTCAAGAYYVWANSADTKLKKCENGSITDLDTSGGSVAFSSITSATSTNAFVMGTGGTLGFSGTGTIDANRFKGNATIAVADGGTNKTAWTQYAIPYASTTAIISEVNIGTAAQCLQVNGTATGYQWGSCGGGSPTIQNNGSVVGSQPIINFIPGTGMTYTITENVGATRIDTTQGIDTTIVPRFANAGTFTGKQTFTVTGGIAAFKLTPGIAPTTTLTAGDFYVNSTSQKVFHYDGSGFVQLMNNLMTAQGDIVTGGTAGAEQRLALGATGTFLYSNGTDPIWRQPLASDISNAFDTNADNAIGAHFIDLTNIAPPANPAATHARLYFRTSTSKLACIDSAGADCMPAGAGGGDFSSNTSSSVDGEIVLFSGTAGKTGRRATLTGLATVASGVLGVVTAPSGAVVGTTDTQTLSAKTLTTPILGSFTVAGLPAAGTAGRIARVTDGSSSGSCTSGGGSSASLCYDTGSAWAPIGDGGSGGSGGADDVGANANGAFSLTKASATSWTIPGTTHGLGTCDILYSFYSTSGTVRSRVDPQAVTCETVAGATQYDVTVTWASAQAGRIIMQRAMVGPDTYAVDKTSATSWTIAGTLHGMAGCNLTYAFYSTSGTVRSLLEPQAITCETAGGGTQYDITVTWASAQAGRAVVLRNSQRSYSTSKASATTWTITGDTHGQRTCDLSHMFTADSGTLRTVIQPQSVSCETAAGSSQYDLTVTWASAQAGYVNIATAGGLPLLTMGAYTVANLPAAGIANRVAITTDSLTAGNCTTGGGSARTLCRDTGSAWESLGGGGGGASPAGSGTEIQARLNGTTFQEVVGSSISGGIITLNPSTTPGNALVLDIAAIGSAGTRDSQNLVLTGRSNDGTDHNVDWRLLNDVTSNAGASTLTLQSRIDAGSFASRLTVTDGGTAGTVVFDASTGFRIAGAATSGRYLRGNGTNFIVSSGNASGTGTCSNQFVRSLADDAAPTCATVVSADVDKASFVGATWLNNSDSTWTFDTLGGTSPVLSFTGANINVSTGGLQIGGVAVGALATAGSAGIAMFNQGTNTTAARSDHTHRQIASLTFHFPGVPASGVAPMTLTVPTGITNATILNIQATANTPQSGGTTTLNVQRCTASCTGTTPTFSNIYATGLGMATNLRTSDCVGAGTCGSLTATLSSGDQLKANLVSVGTALSDVTITLVYKYENTN